MLNCHVTPTALLHNLKKVEDRKQNNNRTTSLLGGRSTTFERFPFYVKQEFEVARFSRLYEGGDAEAGDGTKRASLTLSLSLPLPLSSLVAICRIQHL